MNRTENYTVSFFRNQWDYTKVLAKKAVCVCVLLMNCQSLREIPPSSVIVSPALPRGLKLTYIKKNGDSSPFRILQILLTHSHVLFPLFRSCYPISFWSFCHFLQHSNPSLFLSLSLSVSFSLSLTQQPRGLSLLSWVVFFFFFSHLT